MLLSSEGISALSIAKAAPAGAAHAEEYLSAEI